MMYKIALRDNVDPITLEVWPAVLDESFTRFNNKVVNTIFRSEDDILNWLESKSRTKSYNRHTNIQEFRNGDPNKLYSVYCCKDTDSDFDNLYLYSLRIKKANEATSTFLNEKGQREQSSFKKININTQIKESIDEYSSEPREIMNELYEGIYPFDVNNDNNTMKKYMNYVNEIHNHDPEKNRKKEYAIVLANDKQYIQWLEQFLLKLQLVEKFLMFFSRGGNIYTKLEKSDENDVLCKYILKILDENIYGGTNENELHTKIRNLVVNPYLYKNEMYQIRYNKTFISWHKNYGNIIKENNMVPSKTFANIIMNFTLADFYKQFQSKNNLLKLIENLESMYNIQRVSDVRTLKILKKNPEPSPKFKRITRSFV